MRHGFLFSAPTLLLICILAATTAADAAQLREMEYEFISNHDYKIFRTEEIALLYVESPIEGLVFDTTNQLFETRYPNPGIYELRLRPGNHRLTVGAEGYVTLQGISLTLSPKEAKAIRITPKVLLGPGATAENRATLVVRMTPPKGNESVYGALDGAPPQKLDFSTGEVVFSPRGGRHTIEIIRGRQLWSHTFEMAAGETLELEPVFGREEKIIPALQAGVLYIESVPPVATVYLNDVKHQTTTPLTIVDVHPGTYRITLEKSAYKSMTRLIEVGPAQSVNEKFVLDPDFANLTIRTNPAGATIRFDNSQRGQTPRTLNEVPSGLYVMELSQDLYHTLVDTVMVEAGKHRTLDYNLKPAHGSIMIESEPAGARVTIDSKYHGQTPLQLERFPSGIYRARVEATNAFPDEFEIVVRDGEVFQRRSILRSSVGWLNLTSEPSGAVVRNKQTGTVLGRTPLRNHALQPGTYSLALELNDYEIVEMPVPIRRGETETVRETMQRKTGILEVHSRPQGARITIDGRSQGSTPSILTLPTGQYELHLGQSGYDALVIPVIVKHNQRTKIDRPLSTRGTEEWRERRARARKLSLLVPGGGQYVSGRPLRGTIYLGGFLACLGLTYKAYSDFDSEQNAYNASFESYRAAISQQDMDRHYQDALTSIEIMNDHKDSQKMFLMAAGGVYVLQLFDALIFGGGDKPVTRTNQYGTVLEGHYLVSMPESDGYRVGVRVSWGGGN